LAKLAEVMFVRLYVETDNEAAQKVYESLGMKRMPYYMYDIKID
jgi:ribosomal protein S18 acetylase RimI-like enzyme